MTATWTIEPLSLRTTLSASATVVPVAEVLPSIIFNSATVVAKLFEPSFNVPYVTVPEVVIAELPLLIPPKPDVIEPELRAPTVVAAVVV